jgi:putative FmdB family regulatory protein
VPTYEYACSACAERHEVVQRFTDAPLTECPSCGGPLRKLFSSVGVVFKGSGFYKTDSRGSSSSSSSSSAPAAPDKPAEKTADKTSEKPASPAPATPSSTGTDKAAS